MTLTAQCSTDSEDRLRRAQGMLQNGRTAALGFYKSLLAKAAHRLGINRTIGHALKTVGKQEEAIAADRRAYAVKPEYRDAYWSLVNPKRYQFEDGDIAQMRAAKGAAATPLSDRDHLCFALGKALKKRGDYFRLLDHWNTVLPGRVLRVDYQDVVTNLEPQVRRLFDIIGVPFDQGCRRFHGNERDPEPVNMLL